MQRNVVAGIALLAALMVSAPGTLDAQESRWGKDYFPNLPVVTQDGKTLQFYDDVIKGKTVLISFIYTTCPDICPLTTARLAQVEQKLGDLMGRDIFFISLSVDPEKDTPERLKAFADAFHAGPGWLFLTGKPEDMRAIRWALGDRSTSLSEHRQEIVLGNEPTNEWQRNSAFGDMDRLIMDIRSMDPKWRNQEHPPVAGEAGNAGFELSKQPGEALFRKICAPCHTIAVGNRVGPDLFGVTSRREHSWLVDFIMNPPKVRAQNDPVALALAAKFPGVRMPLLGMSKDDAEDLIAYIDAQTSRLKQERSADEPQAAAQQHHHH